MSRPSYTYVELCQNIARIARIELYHRLEPWGA
jgi:hypothetical protein